MQRERSVSSEREKRDGGGKGGGGENGGGCKPVSNGCNKKLAIAAFIVALVACLLCVVLYCAG